MICKSKSIPECQETNARSSFVDPQHGKHGSFPCFHLQGVCLCVSKHVYFVSGVFVNKANTRECHTCLLFTIFFVKINNLGPVGHAGLGPRPAQALPCEDQGPWQTLSPLQRSKRSEHEHSTIQMAVWCLHIISLICDELFPVYVFMCR